MTSPFWRSLFHYDAIKVIPWIAARNALGVAAPLIIGAALGHPTSGLIASTGALNVAFSDGADPYLHRLRRMLSAGVLCSLAVFTGGLCGQNHALAVTIVALAAFAAGMMVAVGTTPSDIANVTLVTLIVYSAQTMTPSQALDSGFAALAGGLLQTGLSVALLPFRRYTPERHTLANFYRELARTSVPDPHFLEAPPASAESIQAQTALAPLGWDHSIEAERYLSLLSQAERIRLAILALARIRTRIAREPATEAEVATINQALELAGKMLAAIASVLNDRDTPIDNVAAIRSLAALVHNRDARHQIDALAGQLAAAWDVAAHTTTAGSLQFERREAAHPWALRLSGPLARIRANLHLRSAVFRHAVRLTACVTIGEELSQYSSWRRTYWMPMTAVIVLRPDFLTTFSRGVLRVIGTLIGLGFATALFHLLSPPLAVEIFLIALFTFLMRCFGPANYGIFTASLSALIVLLFAATGIEPGPVIVARALNTCAGGMLALAAYRLWPTWEKSQVQETLAQMFDAFRAYFRVLTDAFLHPDQDYATDLDRTRQAGRLARTNAEASVGRIANEPGVSANRVAKLNRALATSHRLAHAFLSLEAGLERSRSAPPRHEFQTFADHVDLTLYYLSSALRGVNISPDAFPDLREDHNALLRSGDARIERYALTNVEADRITNSLNTLAEELIVK